MKPPETAPAGGRHFLQIPGPGSVPDSILQAISKQTIDHRGPDFAKLTFRILEGLQWIFQTENPVIVYPSSGTGAWEAALANSLNPGDTVLAFETGHFATLWKMVAGRMGFNVVWIEADWRSGVDVDAIQKELAKDEDNIIKAVMIVHNETSTGVTSNVEAVRNALDDTSHPALLMVDVVSSLGTCDYRHDEWGVDVAVCASQKGLMLPPGLGFNVISNKALTASKTSNYPGSYWDWQKIIEINQKGFYPYTPSTNLFFGLEKSLEILKKEGLDNIFKRHALIAGAVRAAVDHWGLENVCQNPDQYSASTTAVVMPGNFNADEFRMNVLRDFNMSLGTGLGKLKSKVFRIGHLGDVSSLSIMGALAGIEMGMIRQKISIQKGGVQKAMEFFNSGSQS